MNNTIEVQNMSKHYGEIKAVNDISFAVKSGEIFGLLGPNGAGKSSILSVMQGLRSPTSGAVHIFGLDVCTDSRRIKQRIGVQLQSTSLLPDLNALEQVLLFAKLYGRSLTRERAIELLKQVALSEKANALPAKLSGGQQQRLALALALVNDPEILFLDEPTAGLDPQARRNLWDLVQSLRRDGRTIVLTTHYMEEAEALCDRVGIIDSGNLLALDTPNALIQHYGERSLEDVFLKLTGRRIREV